MTSDPNDQHVHTGTFAGLHSHGEGPLHWHDEFGEHTAEGLSPEELAARQLDWKKHNLQLVTLGIDIGSATSHFMFSRLFVQLVGEAPDVHSVVVGREILWQSPIILTPYLDDDTIDAAALERFVVEAYEGLGIGPSEIDTGAIILTGEALKRKNAQAIGELFAKETGKFVRAAAGHHLEAVLAANGSGTVARSRRDKRTLLNVDIGGGTTKLALVRDGEILATAAVAVGARVIVRDPVGRITRLDEPARTTAAHLGIDLRLGGTLSAEDESRIVDAWLGVLHDLIAREAPAGLTAELMLTDPLPNEPVPQALTFSGGVSEFLFDRETDDFGDMGKAIAAAISRALSAGTLGLPAIIDPNLGIRATAIGASLFTVQVGIRHYVSDESVLPLLNVPVIAPRIDLWEGAVTAEGFAASIRDALTRGDFDEGEAPLAISLSWPDALDAAQVEAVARGIIAGLPATLSNALPIVILLDQTAAQALGRALKDDFEVAGPVIALENMNVREFDFVDVQPIVHPTEVVPVNIKSLLFAGGLDRRSVKQALIAAATAGTRKSTSG